MDFADILKFHGYKPKEVRLARHAGRNGKIYQLWQNNRRQYDLYGRIQLSRTFGSQKYVAHFIAPPTGGTLFTGFFMLNDQKPVWPGLKDPVSGRDVYKDKKRPIIYDVAKMADFDRYAGKLFIEWGGSRNWSQIAGQSPKPITELRKKYAEPDFPGFSKFTCSSKHISTLPEKWKTVLTASRGVYILVHNDTQKQYIGSATGVDGFLGRWLSYETNGHGGNLLLKKLKNKEFQIGILEVSSSSETDEDILRKEQEWKAKIGSKAFGLNAG